MWAFLGLGALILIGLIGALVILDYDDPNKRKIAAVILVVAMLSTTVVIIYQTDFLGSLEGQEGGIFFEGYSPYQNKHGDTSANGDYDNDGIINMFDTDCDDDGVSKYMDARLSNGCDCTPFYPDYGIADMDARWEQEGRTTYMEIRVYPVLDSFNDLRNPYIRVFVDGEFKAEAPMRNPTILEFPYGNAEKTHNIYIEAKATYQSEYANTANDFFSYTLSGGVLHQIQIGIWYSKIEKTIQGVIRNNQINDPSKLDDLLKILLASIPLWVWLIIIIVAPALLIMRRRRKKKSKPKKERFLFRRIWDKIRKRKPPHAPGDIEIRTY